MDQLKRIRQLLILVVFISFYSCESKSELRINDLLKQLENQKKNLGVIGTRLLSLGR